jgi:hypothetical protein
MSVVARFELLNETFLLSMFLFVAFDRVVLILKVPAIERIPEQETTAVSLY